MADLQKHRGKGLPLWYHMGLVEIYRHLRKNSAKVTPTNFHTFVKANIHRESTKQWNRNYDKIKYDVLHGCSHKCKLSKDPSSLVRHLVDRAAFDWLVEVRKDNGVVSGRQLQAAAATIFHVLVDGISPENISLGRPISFTASWRTRMKEEYCIASFSLKGEAGAVDMQAIEPRVAEICKVCSEYNPDDIYNCKETGIYLLEMSTRSFIIPELNRVSRLQGELPLGCRSSFVSMPLVRHLHEKWTHLR